MFSISDTDDVFGTRLSDTFETASNDVPQLYLVQHSWWNEARESAFSSDVKGVSYLTTSTFFKLEDFLDNTDELCSEIVMEMTRDDTESLERGVSCEYALLPDWMFLRALKWHNDADKIGTISDAKNTLQDLFSLKIRYLLGKMKVLVAKISQKDNEVGTFERACKFFCVDGTQFYIWDFSGQITQFTVDDKNIPASVLNEGIFLEVQLYGLLHIAKEKHQVKDKMVVDHSKGDEQIWSGSPKMDGCTDVTSNIGVDYQPSASLYSKASAMGLTGLLNIGNTCFMNSAIQCLVHTTDFVDYFLGNFQKDLNIENPLGRNGKLALAFGNLFRKMWTPGLKPLAPSTFKSALTDIAPQFSGYSQHDSQEFLAFLLDGLHEDLNRVKCKPYIEIKDDAEDVADNEVADEHWRNHLARNDSIIVDVCQGQFRSKLVCPVCEKVSITYDPFMYLSLPLPITSVRTITLTVISTDGSCMPIPVTVTVPKFGRLEDLVKAVSTSCSLHEDETLLLAEVFWGRIWKFLDNPADSLNTLRDLDRLVAYRFPKDDSDSSHLVVFMHQYQHQIIPWYPSWKKFDIPLVTRISDISKGSEIQEQFLKLLDPFLLSSDDASVACEDVQTISSGNSKMKDVITTVTLNGELEEKDMNDEVDGDLDAEKDFYFSLLKKNNDSAGTPIKMNEPLPSFGSCWELNVLVSWPTKMMNMYDTARLSSLPEICKSSFTKEPQESISFYNCLERFLREESLGPEDMWYCPKCKEHRQARKKLDLWRLPEILIIHLKRFSYNRFLKNKLEAFVDFPVEYFDLENYTVHRISEVSQGYELYAIINHYGDLGGGHYTAFVKGQNKWYEFDDNRVLPVVGPIKTSAAYVLFYRRV